MYRRKNRGLLATMAYSRLKEPQGHRNSLMITLTKGPAAAFGSADDDDDDKYSVSELSLSGTGKASKDRNNSMSAKAAFVNAGFNKSQIGLERMKSVVADNNLTDTDSMNSETCKPEKEQGQTSVQKFESPEFEDGDGVESQPDNASGDDVDSTDTGYVDNDPFTLMSSFALFAQTKFQLHTTHVYSSSALHAPLLPKQNKADTLASLASWVTILRIMGDMPDGSAAFLSVIGDEPSVISKVKNGFGRKYTKKDVDDSLRNYSEYFKDPMGTDITSVPFLPSGKETMLEKIQYLCAIGIYKVDLRDEMMCQLCKQLSNNPSRNSTVRGWVLMQMFASSFSPTEKFAPCFRAFLREGPAEFAQKVERLTRRTSVIGNRGFPPSWLEFQAAKNSKPILVPIAFMNGQRVLIEVDPATTVQELSNNLAETLDFKTNEGFSIYVCLHEKISCLGHGLHRIMDAVSECEQHSKLIGMRESSSLWRLYYRKEYFTPWHNPKEDPSATDIIYQQVMRGISLGEYPCEKEDLFILLAAQRFYLEHYGAVSKDKLETFCVECFPEDWIKQKGKDYFVEKVEEAIKTNFEKKKPSHLEMKADIVTFALNKWATMFTRYYDATKLVGPAGFNAVDYVFGISSKTVYILDNADNLKITVPFYEIVNVSKYRHTVTIVTVKQEEYFVTSNHADDLAVLLTSFLEGLRSRSKYAIVTEGGAPGINLVKGDLVTLTKPYSDFRRADIFSGVCKRTGKSCDLPRDQVYIPHMIEEPSPEIMEMFTVHLKREGHPMTSVEEGKSHTLEKYSRYQFRLTSENAVTKIFNKTSLKRGKSKNEAIWQFSKDAIKKPLLRKSLNREDARVLASRTFSAIQQFMGDAVVEGNLTDMDLAIKWVVEPASRSRYLRDEVFCQVVKQLTHNPNKSSEERGWVLLLLLINSALPGELLYEEILKFVRTSKMSLAGLCKERLERAKLYGCRLWPPHPAEYEMLTRNHPNVCVKIYMPDNTCQTVDVTSVTRIGDIKREVCTRLRLKTWEEYCMFMSLQESLHAVAPNDFYFDCLSHAEIYWVSRKPGSKSRLSGLVQPTLVMLKKIWVNIIPEHDPKADITFHFPQELPNFLRNYHKCSDDLTAKLASLVYRAKYGRDRTHLTEKFTEISSKIVPKQALTTQSPEYWKATIIRYYDEDKELSHDEAKVAFLKIISQWETYGSVFFEVKQRTMENLPKYLLVAINMKGFHLFESDSKKRLQSYDFNQIPNWAYDDSSITLIIMDDGPSTKLLLETNVGHNMDDILMAYIGWVMNAQMRRKHGFAGSPVGESAC